MADEANKILIVDKVVKVDLASVANEAKAWLGIPIFGSDFLDPHCKRNSDSVFDSKDSGRIFFWKFRCLESQKIVIPICYIWNSSNLFAQELTTSYRC